MMLRLGLPSIFILVGVLLQICEPASNPNVPPTSFCYDDPACDQNTWGGVCGTGAEQSPINLELKPFQPQLALPTVFKLNDHYDNERIHRFYAQNNGHTAQFELNPNIGALSSDLIISGGKLNDRYRFAQLHFHWGETDSVGSEHRVNGVSYPLEMHIVHYKASYSSLAAALLSTNDREAVAVMAIFFKITPLPNIALSSIITALDSLQAPGQVTTFDLTLRIADLYPHKMEFARYLGSLTTPTCDEKVIWTVFLRPVKISETQIATFRRLSNDAGNSDFNFRRTEPLNGRKVDYFRAKHFVLEKESPIQYTTFGKAFLDFQYRIFSGMFDIMKAVFRRRTIEIQSNPFNVG